MPDTNYVDLINQKTRLSKKLHNLDAAKFGATSNWEMDRISRERRDVVAAIKAIDNILNPPTKTS